MVNKKIPNEITMELNYDESPTHLFKLIEKKKNKEAIDHCLNNPKEAETWVVKKDGPKTSWKLLPLHVTLMMRSNDELIKTLLKTYPSGAEEVDDQGRLPLHLAFRYSARETVVNALLEIFPDGMNAKDHKGRYPLEMIDDKMVSPTSKKKSNPFRTYAAKLYRQQKNNSVVKELSKQLDESNKKIANFYSGDEGQDVLALKDKIQDLETLLKSTAENNEQVVEMFEKRKGLYENEKKFLTSQLESAETENEKLLSLNKETQKRHCDELTSMAKRQQELRSENIEKKKIAEERARSLEQMTQAFEAEKNVVLSLRTQLDEVVNENEQKLKDLGEIINELKNDKSELESRIEEQNTKHKKVEEQESQSLKQMTQAFEAEKNKATSLQTKLNTMTDENEEMKRAHTTMEGEIRMLEGKIQDSRKKLNMLTNENEGMKRDKTALEGQINTLEEKNKSSQKILKVEEEKGKNLNLIIQSLKDQVKESSEQVESQTTLHKIDKDETDDLIALLNDQISSLREENAAKEERLAILSKELLLKNNDSSANTQSNEKRIMELEVQCADVSKVNRNLRRQLKDLFSDCDNLKNAFDLEREKDLELIDSLKLDLNDCEDEIDAYKQQINDLNIKLKSISAAS